MPNGVSDHGSLVEQTSQRHSRLLNRPESVQLTTVSSELGFRANRLNEPMLRVPIGLPKERRLEEQVIGKAKHRRVDEEHDVQERAVQHMLEVPI